jgi:hypothetical protein
LLFTTGSFTLTASPLSSEPDVQRVQRSRMSGQGICVDDMLYCHFEAGH